MKIGDVTPRKVKPLTTVIKDALKGVLGKYYRNEPGKGMAYLDFMTGTYATRGTFYRKRLKLENFLLATAEQLVPTIRNAAETAVAQAIDQTSSIYMNRQFTRIEWDPATPSQHHPGNIHVGTIRIYWSEAPGESLSYFKEREEKLLKDFDLLRRMLQTVRDKQYPSGNAGLLANWYAPRYEDFVKRFLPTWEYKDEYKQVVQELKLVQKKKRQALLGQQGGEPQ